MVVLVDRQLLGLNTIIMGINFKIIAVFGLLLTLAFSVAADPLDREREKLVSDKLAEEVDDGEVLWLDANNEKFLALLIKQTNQQANGAVIILHGMSAHADWPQIIEPIRTALPEHGWTTLSIQLPVIAPKNQVEDYGKTLEQAAARIEAAIRLLHEHKFRNIVAIGHSFGAANVLAYLEKEKSQKIISMVAIGLQDYAFVKPQMDLLGLIEKSKIPVLDIYGSRDFKEATDQAADRRLAAKKGGNRKYVQMEIEGADHYFTKLEDVLIKRMRGWMNKAAPGMSIVVKKDLDKEKEQEKNEENSDE
jgi:pimeloyl-ACP methyl ester carboxylesterase